MTAQNPQTKCPSNDVLKMHLQKNPELRTKLTLVEEQITRLAAAPKLRTRNVEITVPVVVHIVYRTTGENISDAQVRSQIDAMNLDFNKENSDAVKVPAVFNTLAADCDIRFQLAAFDPQGTETYGIVRHYSSQLTWGVSDDIKMPSKRSEEHTSELQSL